MAPTSRVLALACAAALAPGCFPWGFDRPVDMPPPHVDVTASGVRIEELAFGSGAAVEPGFRVKVHYVLRLADRTQVDSSYDRGTPLEFEVGAGAVIPGWEEGLLGMRAGGRRRVTIPPERAYGSTGRGDAIPPGATLVVEIELLAAHAPEH